METLNVKELRKAFNIWRRNQFLEMKRLHLIEKEKIREEKRRMLEEERIKHFQEKYKITI